MRDMTIFLPTLTNVTGRWYDQDGNEIPAEEAMERFHQAESVEIARDNLGHWHTGGVMTMFAPFDLQPLPGPKAFDRPPHLFATAMWRVVRRFGRKPHIHAEYVSYAQTRTMALAGHDQALAHLAAELRRDRRRPWKFVYWHPFLTHSLTVLGAVNALAWIIVGVTALGKVVF